MIRQHYQLTKEQPDVSVGILAEPRIRFTFFGIYSTSTIDVVTGTHEVEMSPSGISFVWMGNSYTSLLFTPSSYDGDTFEIENVTIGVQFHWERRETQRFRGALKLMVIDGKIQVINIINVEDYLMSVISSEMRSTSSMPLLRAHAVISRSWLLSQIEQRNSPRVENVTKQTNSPGEIIRWWDHDDHKCFDVCADDHCQRYQGILRSGNNSSPASAVLDTCGQVLMWNDKLCDARFSKCCGGMLELFETCWGDDEPHPYLVGYRDNPSEETSPDLSIEDNAHAWILSRPESFCGNVSENVLHQVLNKYDLEQSDIYRWVEELTQERIRELLATRAGIDVGEVVNLIPLDRGTSGRIIRLKITGTTGEIVIGKELMIRRALSASHLLSSAFIVDRHVNAGERVPYSFTLHGAGWGHGVGLCQIGAAVMGERGYGYDAILHHYYPGAVITKLY